jgi:predicted SAM-dependent methyltransferase
MKLTLGCGDDLRPGWLNVDCRALHPEGPEFLCCDVLALDGRIEDGAVEHIQARSVLEYLPWREVDAVLAMLVRKLRPGGSLALRVPDGEWVARAFATGQLSHHEAQRLLYGDQGHPADARLSLWSAAELRRRLDMVGLTVDRLEQRGCLLLARGRRMS